MEQIRNRSDHERCSRENKRAGNIDTEQFKDLVERYLASIPPVATPAPKAITEVTPLPFHFPSRPVRAEVALKMQEAVTQVQVTFPVEVRSA